MHALDIHVFPRATQSVPCFISRTGPISDGGNKQYHKRIDFEYASLYS